jgi:short-subunit dehydrogenase/glyoxylase-like metal-dependent hydrolase (beta-lactamase superfamily II)
MVQQIPLETSARAPERDRDDGLHEIAPDIAYRRLVMVNVVFVGPPGAGDRNWVLVDAGLWGTKSLIIAAAEARFGAGARPSAIVLTHGHFDHVGALESLAEAWDVPVYAHALERPYLDGSAAYPPGDPTVGGGLMASLSGFYPTRPVDIASRLRTLPADGSVPGMPGWRWLHTPGHAPGHVSLWRETDQALIVGDAFVTTTQESAYAVAVQSPAMHGPPRYFTIDWGQARTSVETLAALQPRLVVTGHGRAVQGEAMAEALDTLAQTFDRVARPERGRYLDQPARADDGSAYERPAPMSFKFLPGLHMGPRHKPLSSQVIVITGASSGIGLATALAAAERGAKVMLASRNEKILADVAHDIQERGGEARYVVTDVSSRDDLETLAAETIRAYGGFDTWVNNAGLSIFGRIEDVSDADHRRLFEVNFWGIVYGSTVALRHLKTRGGALVNLGSVASDMAFPIQGMYCASKHAIKGFTDALRMELEEEGAPVSVTLIKPASIDTPFPEHAKNYMDRQPKLPPPVYDPQDVADAILHAAEHGSRDIYVGGGGKLMSSLRKRLPLATDWMGAHLLSRMQQTGVPASDQHGALYAAGRDGAVRGSSPHHVMRSTYTRASLTPALTGAILAGIGVTAAILARRSRR